MVTGRLPFEGETPLSIAMKHKGEIPTDPKELNPQIPGDLSQLILKCMEKDKENRYQDAEELRLGLTNIEMGIPTIERVVPRKKLLTSKEITVTFNLKRFLLLALVVAALAIALSITWQFLPQKEPISSSLDTPSIAVLPFEDFSPAKDQEYFCEGLKESIIHALKQVRNLRVPATTSLFEGRQRDYRQIGQKLKVSTVLDGSVQKVEDKVRIIAKLIDIADESIIWTDQFDPEQEDIFSILDKISMTIVDKLKVNLLGGEKTKIVKRYTQDPDAWDLYSWGRYYWNKRTEDGFKTAIDYFDLAIKKDPSYALAHAGLADCYNLLCLYAYLAPDEAFPKAKEEAQKALSIDNTIAEAYPSLAYVSYLYEWDWERAESQFKQAIDLNPNYATAHHWYSIFLFGMERYDEALDKIKRAQELDPGSNIINTDVGSAYYFMRQYDKAIEAYQNVLAMDEGFWKGYYGLADAYFQKEMYEETLAEFQKAKDLYKGWQPQLESLMGITYARMGRREEARQVLDNLLERSKQEYVQQILVANLYFALEENDQGFDWLERAYKGRDPWLPFIKAFPFYDFYDSVRSDPRFIAMLKKIGLDK
jgi:TolB-like protein/Tfp pilus assembly protein PilF